ncbi:KIF-binding protein-like [Musca autumnalis]|uniref:KIF-binding protein-like n=1 Tax=Musca autumnalis TaxID=221902 RepID=UPI003CF72DCA
MNKVLYFVRYKQLKQQYPTNLKLFLQLKDELEEYLTSRNDEGDVSYQVLAHTYHDIGCLNADNGDKTMAEMYFKECLELTKMRNIQTKVTSVYIGALLNLGNITDDNRKALYFLTDAEKAYKEHKKSKQGANHNKQKGISEEDELYKGIIENLARVYKELGIANMSAKYAYLTMKWSFENKSYKSCDLSALSAELSFFYITRRNFKESRRYMAAANYFADAFRNESNDAHLVEETFAYLSRQWTQYGLSLLIASRGRLDVGEHELLFGVKNIALDNEMPFLFSQLPLAKYEKKVTANYCTTLKDAKKVFSFVMKWLEKSQQFYKSDTDLKTYAGVMTDFAKLYNLRSSFENQLQNQIEMQKISTKYFENLFPKLDPKTHIGILREGWYGAGQNICHIHILERRMMEENGDTLFINQDDDSAEEMIEHAIEYFHSLIDSFIE